MKKSLMTTVLMVTVALVGCETEGQKMADLKAHEETNDAKVTLSVAHDRNNYDDCLKHLNIKWERNLLHDNPKWVKFAKSNHIEVKATGLSDDELKTCLAQ